MSVSNRVREPHRTALRLETLEGRDLPSTLTVTNLNDSGNGSLRAQIAAAQSGDTIGFASAVRGTITLTTGEILLSKDLSITGPGFAALTVSGNNTSRVFEVTANRSVSLGGLTIANDRAYNTGSDGSAVYGEGGGMYVNSGATVTIGSCVVRDNTAQASTTFQSVRAFGGGIFNAGTLTLAFSTLSGNTTGADSLGGCLSEGGGIFNYSSASTVVGNTVSGNSATAQRNAGTAEGGWIFNYSGTLSVTNSTFSGNSVAAPGGSTHAYGGRLANLTGTLSATAARSPATPPLPRADRATAEVAGSTMPPSPTRAWSVASSPETSPPPEVWATAGAEACSTPVS